MLTAAVQAQESTSQKADKNILNHMDLGVNIGTVGFGVDVAVPIGNYVRVRAGYNYMPRFTLHSDFSIETSKGGAVKYLEKIKNLDIEKKAAEIGVDLSQPEYQQYKEMADKFRNVEAKDQVTMNLKPNMHQFKFLVDVMPFKNNKHWSFTTGFFVGNSNIGEACSQDKETLLLEAVNAYNNLYVSYCQNGIEGAYHQQLNDIFYKNGIAGIPLGYFEDGNKALMVPNEDGTVSAELKITKVRPYIGFGYNTNLSRNKKWKLNVDAGVMFRCGKPHIYVDNVYSIDPNAPAVLYDYAFGFPNPHDNYDIVHYNVDFKDGIDDESLMYIVDQPLQRVDLLNDLHDIPGKVGDMTKTISNLKVYPNVSVTFSYRLF